MTKSEKTLHRVVMMALAIIVTLTVNLNHALAQTLIDKGKKAIADAKKTADAVETGLDFSSHVKQFIKGAGLANLIGGSSKQQFYMWLLLTLAISLILFRWKRDKAVTSSSFWTMFIGSYGLSVLLAFAFELVHSYQPWEKKSASLLGMAGVLLAFGLVLHLRKLGTFIQAIQKRELYYFRQTWNLPWWVVKGGKPPSAAQPKKAKASAEVDENTETETPEATESQPEAPTSQAAPEPEPTAPAAAGPEPAIGNLVICPHCKGRTRSGGKFCSQCARPLTKAPLPTITCPSCGKQATAKGKFCGHCKAVLIPLGKPLLAPPVLTRNYDPENLEEMLRD